MDQTADKGSSGGYVSLQGVLDGGAKALIKVSPYLIDLWPRGFGWYCLAVGGSTGMSAALEPNKCMDVFRLSSLLFVY